MTRFNNPLINSAKDIEDAPIFKVNNQCSKAWFIVAMAVGAAVIIGGTSFGAIGLLQSHGLMAFPQSMQWLISAIGTVGGTPHF